MDSAGHIASSRRRQLRRCLGREGDEHAESRGLSTPGRFYGRSHLKHNDLYTRFNSSQGGEQLVR